MWSRIVTQSINLTLFIEHSLIKVKEKWQMHNTPIKSSFLLSLNQTCSASDLRRRVKIICLDVIQILRLHLFSTRTLTFSFLSDNRLSNPLPGGALRVYVSSYRSCRFQHWCWSNVGFPSCSSSREGSFTQQIQGFWPERPIMNSACCNNVKTFKNCSFKTTQTWCFICEKISLEATSLAF